MAYSITDRNYNIRASFLAWLATQVAVTNEVPVTRWVHGGATDTPGVAAMADFLEPTIRNVESAPSRKSDHAAVIAEVGVAVRPIANIHRPQEIAAAVAGALANASIPINDHAGGAPGTQVGYLRLRDPQDVNAGMVSGLNRHAVTVDGLFTPEP